MKKNIISYFLASILLVSVALSACTCNPEEPTKTPSVQIQDTDIVLCKDGKSDYTIVIPENCQQVIDTGATEISSYLEKATGAKLPIVSDAQVESFNEQSKYISVGETKMFAESGITLPYEELSYDGYKIVRKGSIVYIAGPTPRATAFGCFEFLEKQINYEVFTATEIYYENYQTLYVKDFNLKDKPTFESRSVDGLASADEATGFRLRLNQVFAAGSEKYGYSKKTNYIPDADHNTNTIISSEKYPQYNPGSGATQICFTQEGINDAYAYEIIEAVKANPNGYIINISQEDGKNFCSCETCKAEISQYKVSGHWVRFFNQIIEKVEAWREAECPQRRLEYTSYFYGDTLDPPVYYTEEGEYKVLDESCIPHKKLSVRITSASCASHCLDHPTCEINASRKWPVFEGWRAICSNFSIWDYAADYSCYLPFYDDINTIQHNKKIYEELGVQDLITEFNSGGTLTQFGYLRLYLHARCMWDVDQDMEELTDRFFAQYYKDVATEMRQVYDIMRTHFAVLNKMQNLHVTNLLNRNVGLTKVWPKNVVEQCLSIIDKALEKCSKITDDTIAGKLNERIMEEKACLDFLKVYLYDHYGYDLDEYAEFVLTFEELMVSLGMPRFSEHENMVSYFEKWKARI